MPSTNKSQKRILGAFLGLSVAAALSGNLTARSADDGSVDSIWMDQNSTGSKQAAPSPSPSPSAPVAASDSSTETPSSSSVSPAEAPKPASSTSSQSSGAIDTAAPMCSLTDFKNSSLITKGGWPGVGPFKPDGANDFSDDRQNRVHVDLSSDQITRAEMTLASKQLSGNQQKDVLDMQMNIDFLLEAVGIKARKIQDLNSEIEKHKEALLKNDQNPLNLVAGRYSVNIEKRSGSGGSGLDYVVVVNSLDADKKIIKQHSLSETKPPSANQDARYIYQDTSNKVDTSSKPARIAMKPPVVTSVDHSVTATSASKPQFAAVIGGWQKVKRGAVKNRQTEDLSSILSGKALVRQMDAIKWLVTNKKFYDMTPKGVTVDQFTEIVPSKKYAVLAQVREAYRFIDEPTGHVIKEVDDVNRVNYTIEKIDGKWLITDSSLLSTASILGKAATPNKTH